MERSEKFYGLVLGYLHRKKLPFMVGGSYALMHYLGTEKAVKDLDIVCRPADALKILRAAKKAGFNTEFTYKDWLGKIFSDQDYIDVIFRTSNKRIEVKKDWFKHGRKHTLFGGEVLMLSPEDVITNKIYVFGRDCYHGHDIYKMVHKMGDDLDWKRIWRALKRDWQILEAHIILFDFVFPQDREKIPQWLRAEIKAKKDKRVKGKEKFRGDLLSLVDYPRKDQPALHNHPLKTGKGL